MWFQKSRVRAPSIAHFNNIQFWGFLTSIEALILGIVQGITEFFPVSSSAHLKLVKKILSIPDGEHLLYFDLLCHLGTLCALLIFLRKEIYKHFTLRDVGLFTLALCPLVPVYFLLKPVRIALSDPSYLGFFLIVTSLLLFKAAKSPQKPPGKKWKNVLWIGCAQTAALIPGISRSGSTIATAKFCGWSFLDGAKFSFLLSIPTIIGGEILETAKLLKGNATIGTEVPMLSYLVGFLSSFLVGCISVRAVFWIYQKEIIRPFGWYCLSVGLLALALHA